MIIIYSLDAPKSILETEKNLKTLPLGGFFFFLNPGFFQPCLQATRAALEGDLNYFRGESTRLATRLGGEETRAGGLQERCAQLEAEVTSLEAQVTSLTGEVSQHREAAEAKEAALERIRDVAIRQNGMCWCTLNPQRAGASWIVAIFR